MLETCVLYISSSSTVMVILYDLIEIAFVLSYVLLALDCGETLTLEHMA